MTALTRGLPRRDPTHDAWRLSDLSADDDSVADGDAVASSILALAVVIDRAWTWWRLGRNRDPELVLARATQGEWTDACKLGEVSRSPIARVLAAGIQHRNPAPTLAMETAARHEIARLERFLPVLDTIVTLSPLLGLLGTVTGMIAAFGTMGQSGKVVSSGQRDLGDSLYLTRTVLLTTEPLRHEKNLLRDWFRREFAGRPGSGGAAVDSLSGRPPGRGAILCGAQGGLT